MNHDFLIPMFPAGLIWSEFWLYSEFHIGKTATPGQNTFSCSIEGQQYYLYEDNNEVFLMVNEI